jgi:F-type H+-transporting ATPase subunit b
MPQLDFANPLTVAQVVWGALIFLVLYLTLRHYALPQVESVLAERESRIAADLAAAREAKAQSDAASASVVASIAQARASAQASVNAASDAAKQQASAQAAALAARLDAQLASAEASIHAARTEAMSALGTVSHDTANAILTRLTGYEPDPQVLDHAIAGALAARGQA